MTFRTRRRVEFRDTDAAGIVHFSAFFPWMESAEHEMLRSVDIAILPDHSLGEGAVTWPRVSVGCDYRAAARFEDWLEIDVRVSKIGQSSVQYCVDFSRMDDGQSTTIANGQIVVVCCRLIPEDGLKKVAIPPAIRGKLEQLAAQASS